MLGTAPRSVHLPGYARMPPRVDRRGLVLSARCRPRKTRLRPGCSRRSPRFHQAALAGRCEAPRACSCLRQAMLVGHRALAVAVHLGCARRPPRAGHEAPRALHVAACLRSFVDRQCTRLCAACARPCSPLRSWPLCAFCVREFVREAENDRREKERDKREKKSNIY